MWTSVLNRPLQSQTDLFGTKILTPQFFLENILALCPKVGGSENFPPSDPPGPPEPLFRGQTSQNREITYFARHRASTYVFKKKLGGQNFCPKKVCLTLKWSVDNGIYILLSIIA